LGEWAFWTGGAAFGEDEAMDFGDELPRCWGVRKWQWKGGRVEPLLFAAAVSIIDKSFFLIQL
jgi:hypothetical protein